VTQSDDNRPRQNFKDAMAELASGVALLTVRRGHPELDLGMTVTSLASASLDPPMVTVGIGRGTSLAPFLLPGAEVGLSILGSHQHELAAEFSRKGRPSANELLAERPHHRGPVTGALLVDDALATLEGRVDETFSAGDHMLVVIRIEDSLSNGPGGHGLIYHRRGYVVWP
jgi:flavin reductase (DIM6/NTAB) family NADH-FMN oxidoreductase RutF